MLALAISICLQACGLSAPDYVKAVEAEGSEFERARELGGYHISARWQPTAYRALHALGMEAQPEAIQEYCDARKGTAFFVLEIGKGNASLVNATEPQSRQAMVYYLSFELQKDLYMEVEGRRIPCTIFQYERGYSLAPVDRFIVGFEHGGGKPGVLVVDAQPLDTGPVKMNFGEGEYPELKL